MPDRFALYPGSFDPPTFGHLDLIQRARHIFPRVLVAIARNDAKDCLFTVEERVDMVKAITSDLPNVEVTSFKGLTADFARERGAVAILRGLRALSDFEFELSMAITNQKLNPDVDTVCLMHSEPWLFLSSGVVKEVAKLGGDISHFVPEEIERRLKAKIANP